MEESNGRKGICLIFYFCGLLIMTLGVAISIKSGLGVSPVSSVPYTMIVVFGIELGLATAVFSIAAALLEIPILRSKYKLKYLLQIPVSLVFGLFMTSCVKLVRFIPDPSNYAVKIILMLFSTIVVAAGVFMYISACIINLPTEGFLLAIAEVTPLEFSTLKIIGDSAMVLLSLATCLIMIKSFGSIGLGTVVSALLVGAEVKFFAKIFGARLKNIIGKQI
ncbi:MAG: hypothetical protein IJG63_00790 [Oscillospiraceae bacterium]|nr:hypothetical protein [Oscillospiraceae bacterium]